MADMCDTIFHDEWNDPATREFYRIRQDGVIWQLERVLGNEIRTIVATAGASVGFNQMHGCTFDALCRFCDRIREARANASE